jgi:hypothetical protein
VPAFTAAQVPSAAFVLALRHDMHVPVHALLQHTPSTQVAPEMHSVVDTQDVPIVF